jgi:dihydrofolate reductase
MRKLISHTMVTLDGFMSGPGGELDWSDAAFDEAVWEQVKRIMSTVDGVLFGRATYRDFEAYWPAARVNPKSPRNEREFGEWIEETAKYVFSSTMKTSQWKNTTVVNGDAAAYVRKLKSQSGGDLLMFGSNTLAASLLQAGLVDDVRLNVYPVLLGAGRTLFNGLNQRITLEHVETRNLNSRVVEMRYTPRM